MQIHTLEQRLREEAARLHSVSMALGLMHIWTRLPREGAGAVRGRCVSVDVEPMQAGLAASPPTALLSCQTPLRDFFRVC